MENNQQENIIKSIYKGRYEELDKIISKKIKENPIIYQSAVPRKRQIT